MWDKSIFKTNYVTHILLACFINDRRVKNICGGVTRNWESFTQNVIHK